MSHKKELLRGLWLVLTLSAKPPNNLRIRRAYIQKATTNGWALDLGFG